MPLQGGDESEVLNDIDPGSWPNWALTPQGIYFLKFGKFPHTDIAFFELASRKTYVVWPLQHRVGWGLSLSADGNSLVYIQNQFAESNLMLVRNFR